MQSTFCKNLSNTVRLVIEDKQLYYQPCCVFKRRYPIKSKQDLVNARNQVIIDSTNERDKLCAECISKEKVTRSNRQLYNRKIPGDAADGDMTYIEIQVNNTCNAACIMCGPKFSSLWEQYYNISNSLNYKKIYEELLEYLTFDGTTHIKILGGEPFIDNYHIDFLEKIPNPENITLSYNTNGSVYPSNKLRQVWKRFNKIILLISIDGIKKKFEYIRWPLQWDVFESNVFRLLNDPMYDIWFTCTLNPLNVSSFNELEEWYIKNTDDAAKHVTKCRAAHGIIGLSATPPNVRELIYDTYPEEHIVRHLLAYRPFDDIAYDRCVEFINKFDKIRNLDYTTVFPGIILK